MEITKWNPFRELEDLQSRLGRIINDAGSGLSKEFAGEPFAFADWAPAVDVQETDADFIVKADLPDIKKEDVKIELQEGVLSIRGERRQEKEEKGKKFHRVERQYGQFVRRFALPTEVDAPKVQAEFRDGVLNVRLPKSASAKPRSVEIKVV